MAAGGFKHLQRRQRRWYLDGYVEDISDAA